MEIQDFQIDEMTVEEAEQIRQEIIEQRQVVSIKVLQLLNDKIEGKGKILQFPQKKDSN